ncbi:chromophore lyase CpcT/CpeT [Flavobacterium sp.]|uniref:chromophore lyase CpcT/CpeT n=1 Tax=Flavobacterium sp. TaxID=239 RepID=UPI002615985D|nr:chromophore lyase CpcT/CpeT [Flavobacterium sp.]
MKKLLFLFILSGFTAFAQTAKKDKALEELFNLMKGNYNSEKQAKADADYYNISLKMVPIWKSKGYYLYVEQALADKQDKPYRVRIYHLVKKGEEYISEIYTLKNEKDWIGKGATPEAFDKLTEPDIELKQGCEVILKKTGPKSYAGATGDKTCPSELKGAAYASSKVTITESGLVSWDQGYDSEGKQVWGAEKGGYVFDKIN